MPAMVKVYNKETGALVWNGADDQLPDRVKVGDQISFAEDVYKVEEIDDHEAERTLYVRHVKR